MPFPLIDAHAHYACPEELTARRGHVTLFCGTDPNTAKEALALRHAPDFLACAALHPWYADRFSVDAMLPFLTESPVIGEIGLDSVWTDVPLARQREAFHRQLDIAQAMHKPIVLHTKGMEGEIAETIRPYTMRKLVHWYSCGEHLEAYIAQDAYFTVGPDCETNPHVRRVMETVPLDRLLTETDGLSAVSWALGREAAPQQLPQVLETELRAIQTVKRLSYETVRKTVCQNFYRFLGQTPPVCE